MDLDEVRRKLTAAYERINNMKLSVTKVETCRLEIKIKREKILEQNKLMINDMVKKLCSLQHLIEVTVKDKVEQKERVLEAKKKEIHDGYAQLVQVCVEADKVLRGRNEGSLGTSCQRLFSNFEAAKVKLDVAERIGADELMAFEFENNMKKFLTNTFVAKLLHYDKSCTLLEVQEFWADSDRSEINLNKTNVNLNNEAVVPRKSPDRSTSLSPKHSLEPIKEVPETISPKKVCNDETTNVTFRPVDVVHIREVDLHSNRNSATCVSNVARNSKGTSSVLRPPPGFSPLKDPYPDIEDELEARHNVNSLSEPQLAFVNSSSAQPLGNNMNVQTVQSYVNVSHGIFPPETSSSYRHMSSGSSSAELSTSSRSGPSLAQKPTDAAAKMTKQSRFEEEDFVWDSDDSAEMPYFESGVRIPSSASSGDDGLTLNSRLKAAEISKEDENKNTNATDTSDSRRGIGRMACKFPLNESGQSKDDNSSSKPNNTASKIPSESSPKTLEKGKTSTSETIKAFYQQRGTRSMTQMQDSDATKTLNLAENAICSYDKVADKAQNSVKTMHDQVKPGTKEQLMVIKTEPVNIFDQVKDVNPKDVQVVKSSKQLTIEKQTNVKAENFLDQVEGKKTKDGQGTEPSNQLRDVKPKTVEDKRSSKPSKEVKPEDELASKPSKGVKPKELAKKSPKQLEDANQNGVKAKEGMESSHAKSKSGEQPGSKPESPRPIKMRAKRLDVSRMLQHVGGSHFEINAKCVEKIRGDFDHPIGVCTNSKGDVIIADTRDNIMKMYKNGRVFKTFGKDVKFRRPSAVVVNEKDEIFVKDDCCLYHFDAEGQFIKSMGKKKMNTPYGLGMTNNGELVVVDALYSNSRLHIFQQDGTLQSFPYEPLHYPYEDSKCRFLAVHKDQVMVSDLGKSCLYLTNLKGELHKTLGRRGRNHGELHEPAGIAVDSVGNWIVADSRNHRVQVFAPNGYYMATVQFHGEDIRRPSGIHLTSDGLLYIINYWDSIIKVFKLGV